MSTTTAMDLLTTNVVQQQINDNFVGKHMFLERVNLGRGFEGVLQKHQIKKDPRKRLLVRVRALNKETTPLCCNSFSSNFCVYLSRNS